MASARAEMTRVASEDPDAFLNEERGGGSPEGDARLLSDALGADYDDAHFSGAYDGLAADGTLRDVDAGALALELLDARLARPALGDVQRDEAPVLAHLGQAEPSLQRLARGARAAIVVAAQRMRQGGREVLEAQAAERLRTLHAVRRAPLELQPRRAVGEWL